MNLTPHVWVCTAACSRSSGSRLMQTLAKRLSVNDYTSGPSLRGAGTARPQPISSVWPHRTCMGPAFRSASPGQSAFTSQCDKSRPASHWQSQAPCDPTYAQITLDASVTSPTANTHSSSRARMRRTPVLRYFSAHRTDARLYSGSFATQYLLRRSRMTLPAWPGCCHATAKHYSKNAQVCTV
mgnify:CR=1 FL=1